MSADTDWDFRCKTFLWKADVPVADPTLQRLGELKDASVRCENWLKGWQERLSDFLALPVPELDLCPLSKQGTFHLSFNVRHKTNQWFLKTSIPNLDMLSEDLTFETWLQDQSVSDVFSLPKTLFTWQDASEYRGRLTRWVDPDRFFQKLDEQSDSNEALRYQRLGVALGNPYCDVRFSENCQLWGWFHPNYLCHITSKASNHSRSAEHCISGFSSWEDYFLSNLEQHFRILVDGEELDTSLLREFWKWMESNELLEILKTAKPQLLHGDMGTGNLFWDAENSRPGLGDWEDRLIGDPVFELAGWATFFKSPPKLGWVWEGYREAAFGEMNESEEMRRRFWLYYWRIALAKSAHRFRFGYTDPKGAAPAICRVLKGYEGWINNADFSNAKTWKDPVKVE